VVETTGYVYVALKISYKKKGDIKNVSLFISKNILII